MPCHGYHPAAMDGAWVLVTDGGTGQGRSALAAVRALAAAGYRAAVTISGPHSLAAASRHCLRRVQVPDVEHGSYGDAVRAELASGGYLTVLPASDRALLAIGTPVARLIDKASLHGAAAAVGLATPDGRVYATTDELVAAGSRLPFPAVVKPTVSRFTPIAIERPRDLGRLTDVAGPFLVQPFVESPLRSLSGVMWRGRLVAAVHQRYLRTWPPRCGGACAAETTGPDVALEEKVVALLQGHEGVFQVQLAGDLLLDVNPRVYGSMPLAVAAQANLVGLACDLIEGAPAPRTILRGRPGVLYRSLEGDIRHRLWAVGRRDIGVPEAFRSMRPRRGTAHGPESLRDPGPMVARARYSAGRILRRTT